MTDAPAPRPPDPATDGRPDRDGPPSGEVRIAAPPAALAADRLARGGPFHDDEPLSAPPATADPADPPAPAPGDAYDLLDWSDPPTGQVPAVLLEESDAAITSEPVLRGPTWRQEGEDFEEELDLSLLGDEDDVATASIAGRNEPHEAPFEFSFATLDPPAPDPAPEQDDTPWEALFEARAASHAGAAHRRRHAAARRRARPVAAKNAAVAVLTGIVLAALVVVCFVVGPLGVLVLGAVALTVAAGEAFGALQRAGYRPATLLGLLAVPALWLAAYLRGAEGVAVVLAAFFFGASAWFLKRRSGDDPITNLAVSGLVVLWVGLLGACGALLLAPSTAPHRHGLAVALGAVILTAAHDIGSYGVGAKFGRHRIAPAISPGKTVEGLVGGTLLDLAVAGLLVARIHPFHLAPALALGILVAILGPLGDLWESRVKREIGVKDMGSLLPAHGGVLDRIDALLFVLPAAYVLARVANLA